MTTDGLWFKDAIFYELHVRAFCDGNEDGVGDFQGLTQKLDYLQELGINCLWLLPFYQSPLRDDGYDISDYLKIHPSYGTFKDFRAFLRQAHKRGIRVIADLPMNHTSDQHPWFQEARKTRSNPKRDYYVWGDTENKFKGTRIIFTDTEISNWTWDPVAKQYYWHRFFSHQPDLNYDNPRVRQEMWKVIRFWMKAGIDGLRLDAVPYLVVREGTNCENLAETHIVLKEFRAKLDKEFPGRILLAEVNQWPTDVRPYFGDGDECHMAFHFPLMPRIFMALRKEDRMPIVDILQKTPAIPPACQWGLFLRNHDELTLEMVSDLERDYMYKEFTQDPRMRLNIGIRRRLAPLMENGRRQLELLNSLLFSLPGSPIVYYGDEFGMGDNIYLRDRDGVRTPMHWNADKNAGFSRVDPARLYSPVIVDPVFGYQTVNVEGQRRVKTSLLQWMKRLIQTRKKYPVFGRGSLEFVDCPNPKVLAYLRRWEDHTVLVIANLSRFVQPAELNMSAFNGCTPVELIGDIRFPPIGELPYFFTLSPHAFFWMRIEPPAPVAT